MKQFFEFLEYLGIHVNESSSPILLFACVILVLSSVALLCLVNIVFYYITMFILDNKKLIDIIRRKMPPFVIKILHLYKKTRIVYVITEFIFLFICIGSIAWLCFRIVRGLT